MKALVCLCLRETEGQLKASAAKIADLVHFHGPPSCGVHLCVQERQLDSLDRQAAFFDKAS